VTATKIAVSARREAVTAVKFIASHLKQEDDFAEVIF